MSCTKEYVFAPGGAVCFAMGCLEAQRLKVGQFAARRFSWRRVADVRVGGCRINRVHAYALPGPSGASFVGPNEPRARLS